MSRYERMQIVIHVIKEKQKLKHTVHIVVMNIYYTIILLSYIIIYQRRM